MYEDFLIAGGDVVGVDAFDGEVVHVKLPAFRSPFESILETSS